MRLLVALLLAAAPVTALTMDDPAGDTAQWGMDGYPEMPRPDAENADILQATLTIDQGELLASLDLAGSTAGAGEVQCTLDFQYDGIRHQVRFRRNNETGDHVDMREFGLVSFRREVGGTLEVQAEHKLGPRRAFDARFPTELIQGQGGTVFARGGSLTGVAATCEHSRLAGTLPVGTTYTTVWGSRDTLDGAPYNLAVPVVGDAVALISPAPMLASNGGNAILRFQVNVTAKEAGTFPIELRGVPKSWTVAAPVRALDLAAGETASFPVFAAVPFAHVHGASESFGVAIGDTELPLAVFFREIPLPTGHHDTLWGHATSRSDGFASTLQDDPRGQEIQRTRSLPGVRSSSSGLDDHYYDFPYPLSPAVTRPIPLVDGAMARTNIAFDVEGLFWNPMVTVKAHLHSTTNYHEDHVDLFEATHRIETELTQGGHYEFDLEAPVAAAAFDLAPEGWFLELQVTFNVTRPAVDWQSTVTVAGQPRFELPLADDESALGSNGRLQTPSHIEVLVGAPTNVQIVVAPGEAARYDVAIVGAPEWWQISAPASVDIGADGGAFAIDVVAEAAGDANLVIMAVPEVGAGHVATLRLAAAQPVAELAESDGEEAAAPFWAAAAAVLAAAGRRRR